MGKEIKLPRNDRSKIKDRFHNYCEADRKLHLLERQFKTCVFFDLVMFAVFSYGMMEPLSLRELVSEAVISAVQLSLILGVGLAIFLQDKKTKVSTDRFNFSNELQKTWGLMVDPSEDDYRVSMATGETDGRWEIMDIDLMSEDSYQELSTEDWVKIRNALP